MRGVKMSPTRELMTDEKAAPIMIPTARSTTLPRRIKVLKPPNAPTVAFSAFCTFGLSQKAMIMFLLLDLRSGQDTSRYNRLFYYTCRLTQFRTWGVISLCPWHFWVAPQGNRKYPGYLSPRQDSRKGMPLHFLALLGRAPR